MRTLDFSVRYLQYPNQVGARPMLTLRMLLVAIICFVGSHSAAQFYAENSTVIDFESNLIWYRCSLGQNFNIDTGKCDGSAMKLNHQEIKIALQQANEQLGGEWRLPSRQELEGLICPTCNPPKVNLKYFPGTESEPYWTGQRNWISPKNYWSVNFMTGDTYGRFFPYQKLFVMIVKDK